MAADGVCNINTSNNFYLRPKLLLKGYLSSSYD